GLSYVEERDIICTIGDSTFLHTGVPGLMNAVYNGARITVAILDNGTTAMTGHQPHPGTGKRATGEDSKKVILESICRACGADFVEVVDPYNLEETKNILERAKENDGVSVVISRQLCTILARKSGIKKKKYEVNENCNGCKRCLKLDCPAIEFVDGRAIINYQCFGCGVCEQICKNGAIVTKK
ncbi:MAG: thiamine pyrophosphate-dependent enzyme, partial [Candidatus Syntropharchaeia archaeon]